MARTEFGGVFAAWLVRSVDADEALGLGTKAVILPPTETELPVYDAPSGALVTDFLDEAGAAASTISIPSADPYIPRFSGPDGLTALWTQAESGRWLPIPHYTTNGGTSSATGDVMLEGGNVHEYADSQSVPWLIVKRPNDNSDSSLWDNMLEFQYWDNATSQYRLGFHLNEKALLRVRGTTPNDVPARIMAHPDQTSVTALFELTLSDNTVKLLQAFLDIVSFSVPVMVPYLVNPLGERLYWGTADPNEHTAYTNYRPDIGSGFINYNDPPA